MAAVPMRKGERAVVERRKGKQVTSFAQTVRSPHSIERRLPVNEMMSLTTGNRGMNCPVKESSSMLVRTVM